MTPEVLKMPGNSRTTSRGRRLAWSLAIAVLMFGALNVSRLAPLSSGLARAEQPRAAALGEPANWVTANRTSPIFWWVWADVREYLGEDAWKGIDTSWMSARAETDLVKVGDQLRYADRFMLAGLWRLGMERDEVLRVLSRDEPEPGWPLTMQERQFTWLWQPRLERWLRAQPAEEAALKLRRKLGESWQEAVRSRNLEFAARVVEALEARLGHEAVDAVAPEARALMRDALADWEARRRAEPSQADLLSIPVTLMERFGVPQGLDLKAHIAAVVQREEALRDEPIPLPHPYDFRLHVLRLQRLQEHATD